MNKDNDFLNSFKPEQPSFNSEIISLMITGKKNEATELIVNLLKSTKSFYALRDDNKEELWMYKDGIYIPEGKSYIKELCREILGVAYSTNFANKVVDKIVADNYINHDKFFNQNVVDEIPVLNGVLHLKTKELTEFTPEKIFFTKINAEYDVDKDCPMIKKFFEQVLMEDDIPSIIELFGYCLWKENFLEKSVLFRGGGSNGKTKMMELLKVFLTPENSVSVPLSQLEQSGSFQVCELHNKLVNIAGELSKSALRETQMFKFLTGRDPITADRKFLRPITFVNYAKLIFSCNDRPPSYDMSDGFFRRWIVFNFKNKFLDKNIFDALEDKTGFGVKDPDVVEHIVSPNELSGLLNLVLKGLDSLRENKRFTNNKSTSDTKFEWLTDSNNFVVFFDKILNLSSGHIVSKDSVRQVYSSWCNQQGLEPVSDKAMSWYLGSIGVGSSRRTKDFTYGSEQLYCWVGCRFKRDSIDARGWSNYNAPEKVKSLDDFKKNVKEESL